MTSPTLHDLQVSIFDTEGFNNLFNYGLITKSFLEYVEREKPTQIISPTNPNYRFYQYSEEFQNKITRPLNFDVFINSSREFEKSFELFGNVLSDIRVYKEKAINKTGIKKTLSDNSLNKVIYTIQQVIGSISDSFANSNRSRKRAGDLFEGLVKLSLIELGIECQARTIQVPIPGTKNRKMSYQLDLVISRDKAILTSENPLLHPNEIVGSVKTTSKDRIDKIFIDKRMLSTFLDRNVKVFAIFLHDVQRARKGKSIFGINSTFKTNHFIGYSQSLNELDGIYYVDPRPNMLADDFLNTRIFTFQKFITQDIWKLTA